MRFNLKPDTHSHEPEKLSTHAYHRMLKLFCTIAGQAEALQYRPRVSED